MNNWKRKLRLDFACWGQKNQCQVFLGCKLVFKWLTCSYFLKNSSLAVIYLTDIEASMLYLISKDLVKSKVLPC